MWKLFEKVICIIIELLIFWHLQKTFFWQSSLFNWSLYESPKPEVSKIIPASSLPDIQNIPDEIINWAIECEVTGRPYRNY